MKILLCHNFYQQRGGEDESFTAEAELLRTTGHQVTLFTIHNNEISHMSKAAVIAGNFWNNEIYKRLSAVIKRAKPDIMHCTNTFPLMSLAIYRAAKVAGIPVVQSLRNYRMFCPGATMLRDGKVCEKCLTKKIALPGIRHGCYRGSSLASAVVTASHSLFLQLDEIFNLVDYFFTPSEFTRSKMIAGGIPAEKILVKPNFVFPTPEPGAGSGNYAVFVGRLSEEKGIDTLLAAWETLADTLPLKIIGIGPQGRAVADATARCANIHWLGHLPLADVLDLIGEAKCLVIPSVWYETFGRTIVEAYAKGTPVIGARIGGISELIREGRTGYLFEPGNAGDLIRKVHMLTGSPERLPYYRREARLYYEDTFTAERNYELLMDIYQKALGKQLDVPQESTVEVVS